MIYLDLFLGFLKVGCFAFGGGYGAIPLIRDVVLSYGWLTDETLTYMIAVSESTPGPIMVNLATYVGSSQGGVPGALIATTAVVIPSFVVIILIMTILNKLLENQSVQMVLKGIQASVIGIIMATGMYMVLSNCFKMENGIGVDWKNVIMTMLLFAIGKIYHSLRKKTLSSITLIIIAACLGIVIYGISI